MNGDLLCFGFLCTEDIPLDKRKIFKVKNYSHLDNRVYKYIESAIECAHRNHFDIFIYENDERVTVCLYLAPCVLFSKRKNSLAQLIQDAEDCFIFKDDNRVTFLEIRLYVEKRLKKS